MTRKNLPRVGQNFVERIMIPIPAIPFNWQALLLLLPLIGAMIAFFFLSGIISGASAYTSGATVQDVAEAITGLRNVPTTLDASMAEKGMIQQVAYDTMEPLVELLTQTALAGYWTGLYTPEVKPVAWAGMVLIPFFVLGIYAWIARETVQRVWRLIKWMF